MSRFQFALLLTTQALWSQSETIVFPRPLLVVAERLQAAWGRPVTYEEPRWLHGSDISMEGDPLRLNYGPRMRTAALPATAVAVRTRTSQLAALQEIVNEFNRANAPLRYDAVESKWGLHLIPVRNKDHAGADAPAVNILDFMVAVPAAPRTMDGHVGAVVTALRKQAGVAVEYGSGALGLSNARPPVFSWGTSGKMSGREALLSLLAPRAATRGWRLNCMPATPGQSPEFCVLNLELPRPVRP